MTFLKLLFRNRLAALGAVVLGIILLLVIVTPILPLQDPDVTIWGAICCRVCFTARACPWPWASSPP